MINRWDRGRAEIDHLLKQGRLTPVAVNRDLAERHPARAIVDRATRLIALMPPYWPAATKSRPGTSSDGDQRAESAWPQPAPGEGLAAVHEFDVMMHE